MARAQQVEGGGNRREKQAKNTRAHAVKQRKAVSFSKFDREMLLDLRDLLFIYSPINRFIFGYQWFCFLCQTSQS